MLSVTTRDAWARELLTSTYAPMLYDGGGVLEHAQVPVCGGFPRAFYAVRDVFAQFAAGEPSSAALYGASVAFEGAGVLILGATCAGKTLLALNLAYRGAQFLGDETALLDLRSGELGALPRCASLREPGLHYLLDASAARAIARDPRAYRASNGRLWYAIDHAVLNLHRTGESYPLRAILFVERRADEPSAAQIPVSEVLPGVCARIHGERSSVARVAALYTRLHGVRGFRVCLGAPAATTELVMETLRRCL